MGVLRSARLPLPLPSPGPPVPSGCPLNQGHSCLQPRSLPFRVVPRSCPFCGFPHPQDGTETAGHGRNEFLSVCLPDIFVPLSDSQNTSLCCAHVCALGCLRHFHVLLLNVFSLRPRPGFPPGSLTHSWPSPFSSPGPVPSDKSRRRRGAWGDPRSSPSWGAGFIHSGLCFVLHLIQLGLFLGAEIAPLCFGPVSPAVKLCNRKRVSLKTILQNHSCGFG